MAKIKTFSIDEIKARIKKCKKDPKCNKKIKKESKRMQKPISIVTLGIRG